ncbi:MAG: hypothetical protein M5U16_05445 [Hyphomicrobium sp.]|nr:hypothetical protein [Hyphomicrobium sp.]
MSGQGSEAQRTHRGSRCGTLYGVVSIDKKLIGDRDERVICESGWPLKEWTGFKAYIFTRRGDAPAK